MITLSNAIQNNKGNYTHKDIDINARKAAAGTLKRVTTTSADPKMLQLRNELQADFSIFDNNELTHNALQTISEGYDIYLVAYEYLYNMLINQNYLLDDTITVTLKNGKEKMRTVYQWACVKVRQYIYSQASAEIYTSTKTVTKPDGTKIQYKTVGYTYIEDLNKNTDETSTEALDREYIRMGKYNGIDTYNDYITYKEILDNLNLTSYQEQIIILRMKGISVTDIAKKIDVTHQAISKQLTRIQSIVKEKYPELIRGFGEQRQYK